jgi:hypothetical protein
MTLGYFFYFVGSCALSGGLYLVLAFVFQVEEIIILTQKATGRLFRKR